MDMLRSLYYKQVQMAKLIYRIPKMNGVPTSSIYKAFDEYLSINIFDRWFFV